MKNVYCKKNGKIVGHIDGNTYYTHRDYNTFFRMYKGCPISVDVLEYIKSEGVINIVLYYHGKKGDETQYFTVEEYLNSPLEYNNEGNDLQKCVPFKKYRFQNDKHNQTTL